MVRAVALRKDSGAAGRQLFAVVLAPELGRSSLPTPEEHRAAVIIDPSRLRLILERLQQRFYDDAPASERIAAAVLADMKHLDESSPLPH
jgi:hypothetical protein